MIMAWIFVPVTLQVLDARTAKSQTTPASRLCSCLAGFGIVNESEAI